jgi:hypothetical protein
LLRMSKPSPVQEKKVKPSPVFCECPNHLQFRKKSQTISSS